MNEDYKFKDLREDGDVAKGPRRHIFKDKEGRECTIYIAPEEGSVDYEFKIIFDPRTPRTKETIEGLTEYFKLSHKDSSANKASFYGTKTGVDIIAIIQALSVQKESGRDESIYPLIGDETASAIIAKELELMGKKPSDVGLSTIETQAYGGTHLIDKYVVQYPHYSVLEVRELSQFAAFNDEGTIAKEISTRLYVRDEVEAEKIIAALADKNIKAVRSDSPATKKTPATKNSPPIPELPAEYSVVIEGKTADEVMAALKGHEKLIPSFAADEVSAIALKLHPNQHGMNLKIAKYSSLSRARDSHHNQNAQRGGRED